MAPKRWHKLPWMVMVFLLPLTCLAFAMSASTLAEFAERHTMPLPYVFPWIVDGSLIGFSVATLNAKMDGRPAAWYVTLTVFFTLVSITFNVWPADGPGWMTQVCHAYPPVVILALFEVMLREVAMSHRKHDTVTPPVPSVTPSVTSPVPSVPSVVTRVAQSAGACRVTVADRAREAGVSVRQWYRKNAAIKAAA